MQNVPVDKQFITRVFAQNKGGAEMPGQIMDVPVWDAAGQNVGLFPTQDGLSCTVVGMAEGTATVTVTATVKSGSGTKQLTNSFDVTVGAAEAVSLGFEFGPVTDIQ